LSSLLDVGAFAGTAVERGRQRRVRCGPDRRSPHHPDAADVVSAAVLQRPGGVGQLRHPRRNSITRSESRRAHDSLHRLRRQGPGPRSRRAAGVGPHYCKERVPPQTRRAAVRPVPAKAPTSSSEDKPSYQAGSTGAAFSGTSWLGLSCVGVQLVDIRTRIRSPAGLKLDSPVRKSGYMIRMSPTQQSKGIIGASAFA
jgi:hypothetical protein